MNIVRKMKNKYEISKYFYDVKNVAVKRYIDNLISRIGIPNVLNLTNGILNTNLTLKDLKRRYNNEFNKKH
jgi:hypothetical protein